MEKRKTWFLLGLFLLSALMLSAKETSLFDFDSASIYTLTYYPSGSTETVRNFENDDNGTYLSVVIDFSKHPEDTSALLTSGGKQPEPVSNVGVVKSFSVRTGFPDYFSGIKNKGTVEMGLYIHDGGGRERVVFFGPLDWSDGWRELSWHNTNYIKEVRSTELLRIPTLSSKKPSIQLKGIVFEPRTKPAGPVTLFLRDISVVYDMALLVWQRAGNSTDTKRITSKKINTDHSHPEAMGNVELIKK